MFDRKEKWSAHASGLKHEQNGEDAKVSETRSHWKNISKCLHRTWPCFYTCMITPTALCIGPLPTLLRAFKTSFMALIINMKWGNPIWVWNTYLTLILVCLCLVCFVELKGTVSNVVVNLDQFQTFLGLSDMLCIQWSIVLIKHNSENECHRFPS